MAILKNNIAGQKNINKESQEKSEYFRKIRLTSRGESKIKILKDFSDLSLSSRSNATTRLMPSLAQTIFKNRGQNGPQLKN